MSEPFRLTLPYPPSANRYWRKTKTGHVYRSDDATGFIRDVYVVARQARLIRPLEGEVSLSIDIYRKIKSGDLSNRIKILEDALRGIAYVDDKQVVELYARRFDDAQWPRAEVIIREMSTP